MPIGRPREFDTEKALELATALFWRKGYEGTSLSDLTQTLGITRPSLYAAFGNKEALFRLALERYEAKAGVDALDRGDFIETDDADLGGFLEGLTTPSGKRAR